MAIVEERLASEKASRRRLSRTPFYQQSFKEALRPDKGLELSSDLSPHGRYRSLGLPIQGQGPRDPDPLLRPLRGRGQGERDSRASSYIVHRTTDTKDVE